jgi:uncharacterized membrane protein YtjA (UPF0391 family)
MLRLLPGFLLAALLGSGGVAAGVAANVPAIVEVVFVVCLTLFFVALSAGATLGHRDYMNG